MTQIPARYIELVGAAALFLASKIEEIYPHKITVFVRATGNEFDRTQILDMEWSIYEQLNFNLSGETVDQTLLTVLRAWDAYITSHPTLSSILTFNILEESKTDNGRLYWKVTTLLDVVTMDVDSLQHQDWYLCVAILIEVVSYLIQKYNTEHGHNVWKEEVMEDFLLSLWHQGENLNTDILWRSLWHVKKYS